MTERDPRTGNRFKNILALRTAKLINHASIPTRVPNAMCICYENLTKNYQNIIVDIQEKYGLVRKTQDILNSTEYSSTLEKYQPKRYNKISESDRLFIQDNLNREVERSVGY